MRIHGIMRCLAHVTILVVHATSRIKTKLRPQNYMHACARAGCSFSPNSVYALFKFQEDYNELCECLTWHKSTYVTHKKESTHEYFSWTKNSRW